VILRDLLHTYSCTYFYSKGKQRWKKKTLPVLNTGESKLYPNKKQELLEAPDFIYIFFVLLLLLLFSFHFFIFLFWDGKVDMMGNLAGWSHKRGCMRCVGYIPERTHQILTKNARVKLHMHEA